MAKNNECIFLDKEEVKQFLYEREKASVASGARVVEMDKKAKDLKKSVEETDRKLRLLL